MAPGIQKIFAPNKSVSASLGMYRAPKNVHTVDWGDDGKMLCLCAHSGLYRMRLDVAGTRP